MEIFTLQFLLSFLWPARGSVTRNAASGSLTSLNVSARLMPRDGKSAGKRANAGWRTWTGGRRTIQSPEGHVPHPGEMVAGKSAGSVDETVVFGRESQDKDI